MSWDLFVGSQSGPIGTLDAIRQKIDAVLPGTDWEDPLCGVLEHAGYVLEFQLLGGEGAEEVDEENEAEAALDGFVISVRGQGEPLRTIVKLCQAYGWSLADTGSGEEIDLDNPSDEGWREFQTFVDGVTGSVKARSKTGLWGRLFRRRG